jgi:hypothetical protein
LRDRHDILNQVKEELEAKQGCHLDGSFSINRVPGNFHISTNFYQDLTAGLEQAGYVFDYTY